MFIGATLFTSVLFTIVITYLLHYCSHHKIISIEHLPYKTPAGVLLTGLNVLLVSATLAMLLHTPISKQMSSYNFFDTFAQGSFDDISYYPENSIATALPIVAIAPPATPIPTPQPAPVVHLEESSEPVVKTPTLHSLQKNTGDIFLISVNGELKGYTEAFLNSLSIFRDLHANTRVMVVVRHSQVEFRDLETSNQIETRKISQEEWLLYYETVPLMDITAEEADDLLEPMTLTIL